MPAPQWQASNMDETRGLQNNVETPDGTSDEVWSGINRAQKKIWKSSFSWAFQIFEMVGRVGFEPTTNWLKANCSTN
jgi:hypothetical protein